MKMEEKVRIGKSLQAMVRKSVTGVSEQGNASNLVTPELIKDILRPDYMEGSIFEKCTKATCTVGHNAIVVQRTNEVNRTVAAGIAGGIIAYPVYPDGTTLTPSVPSFASDILPLNTVAILVKATNQVLSDAPALSSLLADQLPKAAKYYTDHYLLYGDGSAADTNVTGDNVGYTCHGIVNSGDRATKYVTISNTITLANLQSMVDYFYGGKNGMWVMAHDAWHNIVALVNATSSYNAIQWVELGGKLTPILYGFPVDVKDCMNSMDIGLIDPTAICVGLLDPRTDISTEFEFNKIQTAFRLGLRINAITSWTGGITEQSGDKNYPFVFTASAQGRHSTQPQTPPAKLDSSSSSSSYIEEWSSSSRSSGSSASSASSASSESSHH
jgi:HK97 family phage major capsid protein